ncbi:MAG: hypothetical protein GXZ04_09055, partial [Clostridiales bacterium]|nr:hypothetical protein [Clostridiales bacterium]
MKKLQWVLAVLLVAAIVVAGVFMTQKNDLQKKVDSLTGEVESLKADLETAKAEAKMAAEEAAKVAEEAAKAAEEAAKAAEEAAKATGKGEIIYGSGTEISGDWAHGAIWTNNATDNMIRELINDYSTVSFNQGGAMVENASVTESIEGVMNDDGTKTFTIKIHKDLVFNDGSPISAKHFVASSLLFSHPTLLGMGSKNQAYTYYVGGELYKN